MKQFAERVSTLVAETLNKETEVIEVPKTNRNQTGICIKDGKVGAVFYIEDFYNEGYTEEDCATEVVASYRLRGTLNMDFSKYDYRFEAIKDKLVVKLVNIKRNKELLSTLVYRDTGLGLAIIPVIDISENYMCSVSKSLAKAEGYDTEKLIDAALGSSAKLAPARMIALSSFMYDRTDLLNESEISDTDDGFILSNENSMNGAAVMFYEGLLDKVKTLFGTGFYILPSSIHEVILVPESRNPSIKDLKSMVVTANKTVVDANEALSDDVYYFDGKIRKVA